MRIFNTYGPRMRPRDGRVVSNFIVQALSGEPLTHLRRRLADAQLLLRRRTRWRGIYRLFCAATVEPTNIGNPDEYTVRQLAELVLELTGSSSPIVSKPLPEDDPKVRRPDITKARAKLGWEPSLVARGRHADDRLLPIAARHRAHGRARVSVPRPPRACS